MANRTMAAKALKLRRQNRALPRTLTINRKGASGPNRVVLDEYKQRAASLGYEEANAWFVRCDGKITNEGWNMLAAGKQDIRDRSAEILRRFDNPLFVEHVSNPSQRIRIYFNSRQDEVIVQQMHFLQRVVRLSFCFTSIDDAYYALKQDIVPWRYEKAFPDQPASSSSA